MPTEEEFIKMDYVQNPKFKLGKVVATPGALDALEEAEQKVSDFLKLHQSGDWGTVPDEDKKLNDEAVANEGDPEKQSRTVSSYKTSKNCPIWVITEWNRSATTLLLPSEY